MGARADMFRRVSIIALIVGCVVVPIIFRVVGPKPTEGLSVFFGIGAGILVAIFLAAASVIFARLGHKLRQAFLLFMLTPILLGVWAGTTIWWPTIFQLIGLFFAAVAGFCAAHYINNRPKKK